jgi:hypothetical protein
VAFAACPAAALRSANTDGIALQAARLAKWPHVAEFATGQKKTRKPVSCDLSEKTRAVPSRQDSGAIWTARDAIAVVIQDLDGK